MIASSHRRRLLAGGAGTLAMWIAAYVWHRLLLSDFYVENLFPGNGFSDASVPLLFLGYALLGFSMAWLSPLFVRNAGVLTRGLRFGISMGLVAVAPMTVMVYAVHEATTIGVAVDLTWHVLVEQPLGGLVIVWALSRGPAPSATGRHQPGPSPGAPSGGAGGEDDT